jgi:MoxR-like ATPase
LSLQTEDVFKQLRKEIARCIVGQEEVIDQVLVAFLANGHVLLEGVPGTAKTLLAKVLAATVGVSFKRIQFTPDLMPADITGTSIFDQQSSEFRFVPGPVFAGLVLADEINRAPAKTQAALLEAMEEGQITMDGTVHPLPDPFFVIASQNPLEFEGTYPLPEAQIDRFMMKVTISYPNADEEKEILRLHHQGFNPHSLTQGSLDVIVTPEQLAVIRKEIQSIRVEESLLDYIVRLVTASRESQYLSMGASTRAGIHLLLGGKALARLQQRDFLIPDDIKSIALPVLRHRIVVRPEAEIEGLTPDTIIDRILSQVAVPR